MNEEDFNAKMVKIMGDIIKNNLPRPYPQESKDGKKAWDIAEEAIQLASNGRIKLAIDYMIRALRSGVPEPVNNHLKSLLVKLIDHQINHNINHNKNIKHLISKIKI